MDILFIKFFSDVLHMFNLAESFNIEKLIKLGPLSSSSFSHAKIFILILFLIN